jgi:FtsH-binding integral membrane protein
MTKRLTVILIVLTAALLAWLYWLQDWSRILLVNPLFILTAAGPLIFPITAVVLLLRGRQRNALLGSAAGFGCAALLVAVTLFERTETGRALIWRAASAILS